MKLALVAFALLAPLGLSAQTLTVYEDAASNNEYVPFEGYNADAAQHNQMIYPATELTDMVGKSITQMVFYIDQSANNGSNTAATRLGTWTVSLGETAETTLSGLDNSTSLTQVYQGNFDCSTGTLTLLFDDGYVYNGGNLLVDLNHAAASWNKWYFLGVTATGASYTRGNQRNFLPKVTFTYETPAATPKPTGLAVSNILHNEATLNWTENGTATTWHICVNGDEGNLITANSKPYTLTGLSPLTAYTVKVRSVGASENSNWSNEVNFNTTAVAEAVGDSWSDDFEGGSCGWELINGTQTNAWTWGTATNNGGTHALYVSNDGGTTNAYTVSGSTMVYATKLLNFTEGKYEFSYDWKCNGESTYDYLRVALVPASVTLTAGSSYPSGFGTSTLPTGWVALDGGGKLNLATSWQSKSATINVTAGNYYMVLAWYNDNSGGSNPPAAVDNVSITRVACPYDVTGLAASDITTNSATLTWTAGEATQWQVAYSTASNFEGATEVIVDAATYGMTGLTASTNYYVRVRAYCGGTDYGSWSDAINFPTACEALVIPSEGWTENFDGLLVTSAYTAPATRVLPTCWNTINTTNYATYQVFPTAFYYDYTNYAKSTPNCLKLYSSYSTYTDYDPQPQYAILPEMSNLDGTRIKLWARGYNATSTFKIGRMTDPTDASTFVAFEIATDVYEQALTTSYQQFTYNLTGTGDYIAIMMEPANSTTTTKGVYIDDIRVEPIPSCTEPSALQFVSSTTNTATLSWTAGGTESSWDIYYSTTNAAPTSSTAPLANVTTNPATISGLAASTTYFVWVRAHCGDGDGQQSPWIGGINFATKCDAITAFPWIENFESYDASSSGITFSAPCWVNEHISGAGTYFFEVYSGTNGTNSTKQLRLRDMTSGTMTKLMLPGMTLPGDDYQFTLDVFRVNATSYAEEGVRVYASTDGEIEGATELAFISRNYGTGDGNLIPAESEAGWYTYELPINISGTCYIILRGESKYGSHTYMDNFKVEQIPTCLKPSALTFESATTTTATLSWTAGGSETSWDIYYSTENVAPTTQTGTNTADNPATIEGLNASNTYYVWVRAHCTNEDQSPWIGGISFATQCEAITAFPWTENFNDISSGIPTCWDNSEGTTTNDSYKWNYHATGNTGHCVRFNSYNNSEDLTNFLKTPVMDFPAGEVMRLSFWYKNPDGGDFSVYISTDGGVNYTTALATGLTDQSSWTEKVIDLTDYVGEDNVVIVFKGTSNWGNNDAYIYLDDVSLFVPTSIEKEIAANKWYAIAPPVHDNGVNMTIAGVTNLTSGTYDLYGFTESTGTWNAPTETLNQGKGYIYRRSTAATITFVGLPNEGDKAITLYNQCPDVDIDGFNLIGNPFPHVISYSNYYTLQPNGLWLAHDAGNIGVAEGFLVHTDASGSEQIIIDDATPSKKGAPAASPAITFTVSNGEFRDVAYAKFDGSAVLPKIGHLEPNAPALSIPVNGKQYAIADLGNGCESFDMVFSGIGDYSISASGDATYLHLIDKVTGSDIDLLSQSYTFRANIGDITSRFIVKLVPDGETVSAGNFAFRNGNGWTIEGDGTLEAYDALGRRIFAQEISSSNYQLSKASFPAAGVYVLRMGGNSQKIVVTE